MDAMSYGLCLMAGMDMTTIDMTAIYSPNIIWICLACSLCANSVIDFVSASDPFSTFKSASVVSLLPLFSSPSLFWAPHLPGGHVL